MPHFFKLSGAGNDFIALVEQELPEPQTVGAWLQRGTSLGGDGLFTLHRGSGASAEMAFLNRDGSRAELCLNGARAAARLADHLGWTQNREITIATDSGQLAARILDERHVEIAAPTPSQPQQLSVTVESPIGPKSFTLESVEVGVPHVVLEVDDLAQARVLDLGPLLRSHAAFPRGTNVNFIQKTRDRSGALSVSIRTYERGVEAETLACGSGAIATAACLLSAQDSGCMRLDTASGFELRVSKRSESDWLIAGDARVVATGELLPGAALGPRRAC